jgi:hypothetical protein
MPIEGELLEYETAQLQRLFDDHPEQQGFLDKVELEPRAVYQRLRPIPALHCFAPSIEEYLVSIGFEKRYCPEHGNIFVRRLWRV